MKGHYCKVCGQLTPNQGLCSACFTVFPSPKGIPLPGQSELRTCPECSWLLPYHAQACHQGRNP